MGDGYSGIAVDSGKLYTMYRRGKDEVLVAGNALNGTTLWEQAFPAPFRPDNPDARHGPHCTPAVAEDRIVTAGVTAVIRCHERNTGRLLWAHELRREFQATEMGYGYSSHPLVWGDSVIVMAGGPAGLLRFRLSNGNVIWRRHRFKNSNSSPVRIRVDGQEQVVVYATDQLFAVTPESGELLWSQPNPVAHGLPVVTPLWCEGNRLFVSSVYEGCRVLELHSARGRAEARQLWAHERARNYFQTAVERGGMALFSSGSGASVALTALELRTGRILWQSRDLKRAHLLLIGEDILALEETGRLVVGRLREKGFAVLSEVLLLKPWARSVPSVSGRTVYLRDHSDLLAVEV